MQSSAAVLHSGSYKPSLARLEPYVEQHHFSGAGNGLRRMTAVSGGAINEGFRDTNEITLNADVYTRSSSGGSASSSELEHHGRKRYAGGAGSKQRASGDHEWQHLTRTKY